MIFVVLSDQGIETAPIVAADLASAADQIRQRYGTGPSPVNIAILLPQEVGTVTPDPSGDPTLATITATGDASTQQTIRQNAANALANNATFLGLANPTNAQNAAQVQALTRQVDALIRLAVGNFSGTT